MQDRAVSHKYTWPSRFRQQLSGGACPTIVETERNSSSIQGFVRGSNLLNATSGIFPDLDDAELVIAALECARMPNRIVRARDGEEVLRYLFQEQLRPLPGVVPLDLRMPGEDASDPVKHVRAQNRARTLPIVPLVSCREARDMRKCCYLGMNSYTAKPVSFEQFVSGVEHSGPYWMVLTSDPPV